MIDENLNKVNLPKNTKKVFSGVLFDVYQWEQELFDGSKTIFEKVVRLSSSQIIAVTKDKNIVVLEEEQPARDGKFSSLIGGIIEKNETIEENVKKELLEETGMISEKIEFFKVGGMSGKVEWKTFYFIAKNCRELQKPNVEAGEKIKQIKLNFEEFIDFTQRDDFRNKEFKEMIFKMIHIKGELEKFKGKLFN